MNGNDRSIVAFASFSHAMVHVFELSIPILVVVWLVLAITKEFVETVQELLGPFDNLIGLLIVLVIVLWLLDRI